MDEAEYQKKNFKQKARAIQRVRPWIRYTTALRIAKIINPGELTQGDAARIMGHAIDDKMWEWIQKNKRQQEILDSAYKEP